MGAVLFLNMLDYTPEYDMSFRRSSLSIALLPVRPSHAMRPLDWIFFPTLLLVHSCDTRLFEVKAYLQRPHPSTGQFSVACCLLS